MSKGFLCIPAVPAWQAYCLSLAFDVTVFQSSVPELKTYNAGTSWRIPDINTKGKKTTKKTAKSHKNAKIKKTSLQRRKWKQIFIHNDAVTFLSAQKEQTQNKYMYSKTIITPKYLWSFRVEVDCTFCIGGSQVSLGREPQGSPSECCVVHSWGAALRALIYSPEGTKWRTLLVSIAEQVVANAHFLSPTAFPPPKSTHHGCVILCWWVWDHLCSLALLCFWLPLRHMQWLSPTLPAYSLFCHWVLVPLLFPPCYFNPANQ